MSLGIFEEIWIQKVSDLRQNYEVPMKLFYDNKAAISIANNRSNVTKLNMWRLIHILSKRDRTMIASTSLAYRQVNRLLIYLQRDPSNKTLIRVLASWVFSTFMSQLEGKVRNNGLRSCWKPKGSCVIYFALIFILLMRLVLSINISPCTFIIIRK